MEKENAILNTSKTLRGFTQKTVDRALQEICEETGFILTLEVLRRYIFDPAKIWRVHFRGIWSGVPATLCIDKMHHEIEEDDLRRAFQTQADIQGISTVRPPRTYWHCEFEWARWYGWDIGEAVGDRFLFAPDRESPLLAAQSFAHFYRELRRAVKQPFWQCEHADAETFSRNQLNEWKQLAVERHPDQTSRVMPIIDRLSVPYLAAMSRRQLRFMHGHLTGTDVRIGPSGEYVVDANLFWKWRQPAYDVAFPMWGQWLALPFEKRTPRDVRTITETWLTMVQDELYDLVDAEDMRLMVMNRLIGALLLDVQAQRAQGIDARTIRALETSLIIEANRILAT